MPERMEPKNEVIGTEPITWEMLRTADPTGNSFANYELECDKDGGRPEDKKRIDEIFAGLRPEFKARLGDILDFLDRQTEMKVHGGDHRTPTGYKDDTRFIERDSSGNEIPNKE